LETSNLRAFATIRDQVGLGYIALAPRIQIAHVVANIAGFAAFLALVGISLVTRRASLNLLACGVLFTAVAARVVLVALVDATSFPAVANHYLLPASVLTVAFGTLALAGLHKALLPPARQ